MSQKIKREVIRITILGDQAVGKTTLRNVYLNIDFEENTLSTVGSNKSETKYKLEDGKEIKLFLFDTAGQERFRSIALKSVKNSQGVMLVFDVTNKKSFESLVKWLEDIKEEDNNFSMILFGNKCDLPNREVSEEEAENFAKKNNIPYMETSAKLKTNTDEGISILVNDAYKKYGEAKGVSLKKKEKTKKKFC